MTSTRDSCSLECQGRPSWAVRRPSPEVRGEFVRLEEKAGLLEIEEALDGIRPWHSGVPRLEQGVRPPQDMDDQVDGLPVGGNGLESRVQPLHEVRGPGLRPAVPGEVQPGCAHEVQVGVVVPGPEDASHPDVGPTEAREAVQ